MFGVTGTRMRRHLSQEELPVRSRVIPAAALPVMAAALLTTERIGGSGVRAADQTVSGVV